jgi:hypothetical protein
MFSPDELPNARNNDGMRAHMFHALSISSQSHSLVQVPLCVGWACSKFKFGSMDGTRLPSQGMLVYTVFSTVTRIVVHVAVAGIGSSVVIENLHFVQLVAPLIREIRITP